MMFAAEQQEDAAQRAAPAPAHDGINIAVKRLGEKAAALDIALGGFIDFRKAAPAYSQCAPGRQQSKKSIEHKEGHGCADQDVRQAGSEMRPVGYEPRHERQ